MTAGPQDTLTGYADFFDGATAVVRRVGLAVDETAPAAMLIQPPDQAPCRWPFAKVRQLPDQARSDEVILALEGNPVARLVVQDPGARAYLSARCPNLHQRPRVGGVGRLIAWAAAAVASVALIIFVLVPAMADQLARYLPPEGERALGETTLRQIREALNDSNLAELPFCDTPSGTAALNRMQARLTDDLDLPYQVTVHVLDHPLVNAFALPGGFVVFFRGLIEAAETPDEVAAVFAHELGHVVNRDPARGALRTAGSIGVLGLLLGDFAGGTVVLFLAERLINATYSKKAEAAADAFAHRTLAAAGIPPSSMATIFQRLRDKYGEDEGIVAHFAAHPSLGDRIASARAADTRLTGVLRPALSDTEWRAVRAICG